MKIMGSFSVSIFRQHLVFLLTSLFHCDLHGNNHAARAMIHGKIVAKNKVMYLLDDCHENELRKIQNALRADSEICVLALFIHIPCT